MGDEASVPILTGHEVSDHVTTPDAERNSDVDAWGLFVASRAAAGEYYGDVDDEACGDAMTPVDPLLRLSFDLEGGSTDVVEAHVAGHRDEPEGLALEAER